MSTSPLVSILITTYNHEAYLKEALESALSQDYENLEIVIADDASSDGTPELIQQYARRYPKQIVPLLNEKNLGISANHAQGLQRCTGKYVVILDGDDILLPGKISAQVALMESDPSLAITYHDIEVFDSDSGQILFYWSERIGTRTGDVRTLVRYGMFTGLVSVMFRRAYAPSYGYDDRLRYIGDWYLMIEVLKQSGGRIGYIDQVFARYRRHASNVTSNWEAKITDSFLTLALVEARWPELIPDARRRRAELYSMLAIRSWKQGKRWLSMRLLGEAVHLSLPNPFPWGRLAWREVRYWLRHRRSDYMIRTIFNA